MSIVRFHFPDRVELGEIAPLPAGKFTSDLPTCKSEVRMIEILSDPPSKIE